MAYLGGNLNGYETDPLSMGLAYSDNPVDIKAFRRFENPILSPFDDDVRERENLTIYKGYLFCDVAMTTGYKYVNAYNAKPMDNREVIYLAVSNDGEKWERYGNKPIIDDEMLKIIGDPQIVKIDDVYVMIYYIFTSEFMLFFFSPQHLLYSQIKLLQKKILHDIIQMRKIGHMRFFWNKLLRFKS